MFKMCCPHCGNKNLQVTTETNVSTTGKNYSGGKGCLGFLLFGPLGLLCGSCGGGQKTTSTSTTYWVCLNCGHKFASPNDVRKEAKKLKESMVAAVFGGLLIWIVGFLVLFYTDISTEIDSEFFAWIILFMVYGGGLLCILIGFQNRKIAKELNKAADSMEEKMIRFSNSAKEKKMSEIENQAQNPTYIASTPQSNSQSQNAYHGNVSAINQATVAPNNMECVPERQRDVNVSNCTKCGASIPESAVFCPACGNKVNSPAAALQMCTICGGALVEDDAFCKKCGSKIVSSVVQPQVHIAPNPINKPDVAHYSPTRAPEIQAGENEWKCPKCGVVNQNYVGTCGCGTRRP